MHKHAWSFVFAIALLLSPGLVLASDAAKTQLKDINEKSHFTWDEGAIVRGDSSRKRIALIFTGGDYGEGTAHILDTLQRHDAKAGLFVTGAYLRQSSYAQLIRRAVREGHYVGPHSDQHLLYCPWENRKQTLVTKEEFGADLKKNISDLQALGALAKGPVYFIPPYEWYNKDQSEWAREMHVQMFNFSPGSGSNRDYMPESDPRFVSSQKILDGILDYEKRDPHGLNGYILLLHLGADRKDKMFQYLDRLILTLKERGYEFVRVDEMLHE